MYREIPILTEEEIDSYTTWKIILGSRPVDSDDIAHKLLYGAYYQHKITPYIKQDEIFNLLSKVVNNSYVLSSIFLCLCDLITSAIYKLDILNDIEGCNEDIAKCNEIINTIVSPYLNNNYRILIDFDIATRILEISIIYGLCEWGEEWGNITWY